MSGKAADERLLLASLLEEEADAEEEATAMANGKAEEDDKVVSQPRETTETPRDEPQTFMDQTLETKTKPTALDDVATEPESTPKEEEGREEGAPGAVDMKRPHDSADDLEETAQVVEPIAKRRKVKKRRRKKKRDKRKQRKPKKCEPIDSEDEYISLLEEEDGGSTNWHPDSKWQEPYIQGEGLLPHDPPQYGLTLYEVHRRPRILHGNRVFTTVPRKDVKGKNRNEGRAKKRNKTSAKQEPDKNVEGVLMTRVSCDYQNLLDEFRCVICFGTLKRAKIVRECLHRFCESCMETCLRRMSNTCPVCRIGIPSRRSLCADSVFNTIIDALGLGDSDEDETEEDYNLHRVDEAMAIAASLQEASQNSQQSQEDTIANQSILQAAIEKEQQRRGEDGLEMDKGPGRGDSTREKTKEDYNLHRLDIANQSILQAAIAKKRGLEQQRRDEENLEMGKLGTEAFDANAIPGANNDLLVELHLRPHPTEANVLPPLDFPYLRITGEAPVALLETFVQHKLSLDGDEGSPLFFSFAMGSTKFLPRTMKLREMVERRTSIEAAATSHSKNDMRSGKAVALYYRQNR